MRAILTWMLPVCLGIGAAVWFAPAWPQEAPCAAYDDMAKALASKYGESVMERGFSQAGVLVEWWGNAASGTWTILTVNAAGVACIVQAGELFETLPVGDDA
jgi:hypothetical protein